LKGQGTTVRKEGGLGVTTRPVACPRAGAGTKKKGVYPPSPLPHAR